MASDQSRLGPLALAVLTLLCQSQGSIHVLRVSAGGRQPLVQRLARAQQRCPRFRVVDVGAAMNPWTLKVLNAVVDRTPQVVEDCFQQPWFSAAAARFCCRSGPHTWLQANNVTCFTKDFDFERCCRNGEPHQLLHFAMDVNKESAWDPLLHHVEVAGKFEFAVASHILEDIVNPEILLQMLPRIARRGFVAMPSKFTELKRGVEGYGPHRGHIHHRWIGTIQSGQLLLLPKLAFLETIEGDIDVVGNALTADSIDMSFEWEDDIPFSILNKGFVGPTPVHVIQMYLEVFRTADDVDDVYVHGSDEPESEIPCESRQEALPPSSPEPEAAIMSSVQFCSLRTFEGLSRDLAAQLGATGERCFHRELQEVRRRCLMAMKAVEAAMMIYHTCAAGEPPLGSAARSASCQEAASLVRRRNASAVMSACMQETPSGLPGHEARRVSQLQCARAAALAKPEENSIPMELGLDCLASSPLKTSFYNDLGRLFARLPWISLRHPLPYYDRSTFLDFAQSLPTWVSWLFELWYFYDNIFLPMFREQQAWGSYLAPLFRLPPWAVPRGTDRRQRVVENLIQMLAERRAPTKVAMAEVGVFMGDTSASVLTKRLPVSTVHLVDPWDTNEIFQAVAQEKRQEITGAEARKHVEQRFGGLGTVHCFDGPAGAHRPYQGEALAPGRRWSHTCGEDWPGSPQVGIHAAASVDASRRIVAASLDLVFVDGAHDYESVLQDLKAWWPKLRAGGIMAGHDFSMSFPGLMRAVLEFVSMLPTRTEVYLDTDYSFWFFKPDFQHTPGSFWWRRLEGRRVRAKG